MTLGAAQRPANPSGLPSLRGSLFIKKEAPRCVTMLGYLVPNNRSALCVQTLWKSGQASLNCPLHGHLRN